MLLYLCFLLLPALTQAACKNATAVVEFLDTLDDDVDGYITRPECDAAIQAFDVDGNGAVTNKEARQKADPRFKDYAVDEIFRFLDQTKNGVITEEDKDLIFQEADTDEDDRLSRTEYKIFVAEQCQADKSTTTTDYYN
ncbi:hypothetical protein BsWGS_07033 [Bradybaena similaris]